MTKIIFGREPLSESAIRLVSEIRILIKRVIIGTFIK